ncbi:MAG: hypothetical protein ABI333_12810 [bacterium]
MVSEVKTIVIAESAELLGPIEQRLMELGIKPERMIGVSFLPPEPLPHDLLFFAFSADRGELTTLLDRVQDNAQVVALVPTGTDLATTAFLLADQRCNHVLQTDDEHGLGRLTTTAKKLLSGDIFGIEKYLPDAQEVHYFRLVNYHGRSEAIDKIVEFAEASKVRRQVRQTIAQVCEELLMNALYNAPVDEFGRSLFANVTPKDRLALDSPRPVSIRYAINETHFGIAVRDRFGTLTKDTMLRYIHKCLHSRQQIDGKTLGAGLGLYLVASRAREYIVNIAPGVATEAIAVFAKRGGAARSPGTFSVFMHPGSPAELEAAT